jgi:hypothetical protein
MNTYVCEVMHCPYIRLFATLMCCTHEVNSQYHCSNAQPTLTALEPSQQSKTIPVLVVPASLVGYTDTCNAGKQVLTIFNPFK